MSLDYKVLGKPGRDNALFVWVNSGNKLNRILFDCGENVLSSISYSETQKIGMLFLSHLHIDHIAGFDFLFRRIYDRAKKPLIIFGPESTTEIIHHRLRGFKWNLHSELTGSFIVNEISGGKIVSSKFQASEGFSKKHLLDEKEFISVIYENEHFSVLAAELNHKIVSIGYSLQEKDSINIDKNKLSETGFESGAWLEQIKNIKIEDTHTINLSNKIFEVGELRSMLLVKSLGEKITYLTDFILNDQSFKRAVSLSKNTNILVCESQYLKKDIDLAKRNYHLTAEQSGKIAASAIAEMMILFHISDRYGIKERKELLADARNEFKRKLLS